MEICFQGHFRRIVVLGRALHSATELRSQTLSPRHAKLSSCAACFLAGGRAEWRPVGFPCALSESWLETSFLLKAYLWFSYIVMCTGDNFLVLCLVAMVSYFLKLVRSVWSVRKCPAAWQVACRVGQVVTSRLHHWLWKNGTKVTSCFSE